VCAFIQHEIALRRNFAARCRSVVLNESDARCVAAELGVGCADCARRVGELCGAASCGVVDEDFEISVGVRAREVAIGSEREQLAVVGDGRLKVSVGDTLRRVAGRGVGKLV
jgi:hypothetical protein